MCRLLGVVFRTEFPTETLSELKILSEIGRVPGQELRGHRDGWGIVTFRDGRPYYLGRSERPAFSDPAYNAAIDAAGRIPFPNMLVAHVRAASSGEVSLQNTHPFIVDGLAFAHNGTVNGLPADDLGRTKGQTDSELIALLVADRLKEKGSLASAMKSVIKEEIDGRDSTAAIMIACDGRTLVGYRDFSAEDKAAYYALKLAKCPHSVALFQEIAVACEGEHSEIAKRELVTVTADLKVTTELL
jgi:predicted glutamine amidotransferase